MNRKKLYNTVALVLSVAAGTLSAFWVPMSLWFDMKEGLIAFYGFLAATLVQVMPVTANFLQSEKLTPAEARLLTDSLTKQQHYWIGLLWLTIFAMICIIVGSAVKSRLEPFDSNYWHCLNLSSIPSFFIAFTVLQVLSRLAALFGGMLSLHSLRTELILAAAEKLAKERGDDIKRRTVSTPVKVPDSYGAVLPPPDIR